MTEGKIGRLTTEGGTAKSQAAAEVEAPRQDVSREDLKKHVRENARKP